MTRFIKCSCGRTHGVSEVSRDATAEFKINALSDALNKAIGFIGLHGATAASPTVQLLEEALRQCGSQPAVGINPQDACRAYEKPLEVPATGHAVDLTISWESLGKACEARHNVHVAQGAHRGPWKELPRFERARQRASMRAALRAIGITVREG